VRQFVSAGYLVAVKANADFDLHAVSYPYARPEAELFIRRLAAQYRAACGEKLVVTSLTRPQNGQPANASSRSVHPTGMAVDLRRSNVGACRSWLEGVLVQLEGAGILEATRERYPPHYHIAIFPRDYVSHVERLAQTQSQAETRTVVAQADAEIVAAPTAAELDALLEYRVRRGDSLWTIARAYGTTVTDLRSTNALRTSRIYAGQVLQVPVARR
jgi:LysM repeat protein